MEDIRMNPLGDRAVLVHFQEKDKRQIPRFVKKVREAGNRGIQDVIAAFDCVAIYYDPMIWMKEGALRQEKDFSLPYDEMKHWLHEVWESVLSTGNKDEQSGKVLSIPVCYDPECGGDLPVLSKQTGLSSEEIIASHTASEHTVEMIGFSPGFPYLSGLDERLVLPRKKIPRTSVPAGSVAIAGKFTGIYSLQTPGGWNIIGRTPVELFDRNVDPPVLLQAGDKVQFYAISYEAFLKGEY